MLCRPSRPLPLRFPDMPRAFRRQITPSPYPVLQGWRLPVMLLLAASLLVPPQSAMASPRHRHIFHATNPAQVAKETITPPAEAKALWQQLTHEAHIPTGLPDTPARAVLYEALTILTDAGGEPDLTGRIFTTGEQMHWALTPRQEMTKDDRLAGDWVPGSVWLWAFSRTQNPVMIAALRARVDAWQNTLDGREEPCARRRCRGRDIYSGLPILSGLWAATGDRRYQNAAERQFQAIIRQTFDKKTGIFHSENGWAYAGLTRLLQTLPATAPMRPRTEALFRAMSARLVTAQGPDGRWPADLGGQDGGGGLLVYGLAYGIRSGLLNSPPYREAVSKGWAAHKPNRTTAPEEESRGAWLMAGAEIYRLAVARAREDTVQMRSIAPAYARVSVNLTAPARSSLFSSAGYQFAVFYGAPKDGQVPVMVARRKTDKGRWRVVSTPLTVKDEYSDTGARDEHNLIAAAVDKAGYFHISWAMHNAPLTYAVSDTIVTARHFGNKGQLSLHHSAMTGRNETAVTYPEFFTAPDGTLLFAWRNDHNDYLSRYDDAHRRWQPVAAPLLGDSPTDMRRYRNRFVWDSKGRLYLSWTLHDTPEWQNNHNLCLAHSDNGGKNWTAADGTPLGPDSSAEETDYHARILELPPGSSLTRQTDMTIAPDGAALIATWWAPTYAEDNHTRQYMLVRHAGAVPGANTPGNAQKDSSTRVFQVSHRIGSEEQDTSAAHMREMGRPLVLTDKAGRVLIITRSSDPGKQITDASNRLEVYWSADLSRWEHTELVHGNFGGAEPVYDLPRWQLDNRLDLLLQSTGQDATASPMSLLQWDTAAFFARIGTPPAPPPAR